MLYHVMQVRFAWHTFLKGHTLLSRASSLEPFEGQHTWYTALLRSGKVFLLAFCGEML